ncbi:ABC transporter ATP-binding protein [Spiroplasma endosymbiont of Aspidapion aeneum]|uniref:ABC transporter ATP-binding protein n=1 Tax=Spiroplasma endosymbiont of Aspidapion aeneum TaxID=3066276 RepID=UPI00313E165E
MNKITISNISKSFKSKKILDDLNIEFVEGKVYGLLGLNGSGKTTLLRIIFNEVKQDTGLVKYNNNLLNKDIYSFMYYYPENDNIPLSITIFDYWISLSLLANVNKKSVFNIIESSKELLKGINYKKTIIRKLSSGQKKIVSLISCFILKPKFIFLDEPTANLDKNNKDIVLTAIREFKKRGMCVIVVTHLFNEIDNIIDQVIILDKCKIVYNNIKDPNISTGDIFNQYVKKKDLDIYFKEWDLM